MSYLYDCGKSALNSVVITVNGSGVIDGLLDISSFDSDGYINYR